MGQPEPVFVLVDCDECDSGDDFSDEKEEDEEDRRLEEEEMGGKSRSTYLTSSGLRSSIFVTPRSCMPVSISPLITE